MNFGLQKEILFNNCPTLFNDLSRLAFLLFVYNEISIFSKIHEFRFHIYSFNRKNGIKDAKLKKLPYFDL